MYDLALDIQYSRILLLCASSATHVSPFTDASVIGDGHGNEVVHHGDTLTIFYLFRQLLSFCDRMNSQQIPRTIEMLQANLSIVIGRTVVDN